MHFLSFKNYQNRQLFTHNKFKIQKYNKIVAFYRSIPISVCLSVCLSVCPPLCFILHWHTPLFYFRLLNHTIWLFFRVLFFQVETVAGLKRHIFFGGLTSKVWVPPPPSLIVSKQFLSVLIIKFTLLYITQLLSLSFLFSIIYRISFSIYCAPVVCIQNS